VSKFIDRLKQVSQPPPPPIGFRHRQAEAERPRLQLVALLQDRVAPEKLAPADAVVVTDVKSAPESGIRGVTITGKAEADTAIEAEADFVVLPADSPVISSEKKIGKVLEVNTSITDVLLRTVNELPVDAVLLAEDEGDLTWQKLMLFQRFAGILTKPVLVKIIPQVSAEELQLTWDAGVCGVAMKTNKDSVSSLADIRKAIDSLKFPVRAKKERLAPSLPNVTGEKNDGGGDEEEEDDD